MPLLISLFPLFFLTVTTSFPCHIHQLFFLFIFSLHLRSAELAHSLLNLVTLDSQVFIKSAAQKFPVIYCHCEKNLLLFDILFLSNPNPEVLHCKLSWTPIFHKLRKYIYSDWRPFMYTCSACRSGARYGGMQSFGSVSTLWSLFSPLAGILQGNTALDKEANHCYARSRGQRRWECWLWSWQICLCGSYFCN